MSDDVRESHSSDRYDLGVSMEQRDDPPRLSEEPFVFIEEQPSPVSRGVTAAITFVLGAVYGTVGTVTHTLTFSLFGVPVPHGLVLGLIGLLALLVGLRLVVSERLPAVTAGVAAVAMVVLFSFQSPGGSVLITQGILGMIWLFGVPLIVAAVLAWPRLPARSRRVTPAA